MKPTNCPKGHGYPAVFCPVCMEEKLLKSVVPTDTLSGDTCTPRHGDLSGDLIGDAVTCIIVDEQGVSYDAGDLGSVDKSPETTSTGRATPPSKSPKTLTLLDKYPL